MGSEAPIEIDDKPTSVSIMRELVERLRTCHPPRETPYRSANGRAII